jgi:hypothetical protein
MEAPCEGASAANAWSGWENQHSQGQKGAYSGDLNIKRFVYGIFPIGFLPHQQEQGRLATLSKIRRRKITNISLNIK